MSRSYRNSLQRAVTDLSNARQRPPDEVVSPRSLPANIHLQCNAPGPSRQNETSPPNFHELDCKEYEIAIPPVDNAAKLLDSLEMTLQELVKARRREASLIMENQHLRMTVTNQNTESPDTSNLSTGQRRHVAFPSSDESCIETGRISQLRPPGPHLSTEQRSHVAIPSSDVSSIETGRISQLRPPGLDVLAQDIRQISLVPNSASLLLPLDTGPGNAVNQLLDTMKSQTILELQAQSERLQTNMLALDDSNQRLQLRLRLSNSFSTSECPDLGCQSLPDSPLDDRALRFRRRLLTTITQLLRDKSCLLELLDGLQRERGQTVDSVLSSSVTCQGNQNEAVQLPNLEPGLCNSVKSQTGNNMVPQNLQTTVQKLTNEISHLRSKNESLIQENNCLQNQLKAASEARKHCVQEFKRLSAQWNTLYTEKVAVEQEVKALTNENCDLKKKCLDLDINRCSAKNVLKPSANNECAALHESVQQHLSLSVTDGQRVRSEPSQLATGHGCLPILESCGRASRRECEHVQRDMEDNAELRTIELATCGEKQRRSDSERDSRMLSKKFCDLQKENVFLKGELEKCIKNNAKLEMAMEKMNKEKHVLEDYLHVVQKVTKEPFSEAGQVPGARSCRSNTNMLHNTSDNLASSRIRCAVTYDEDKEGQQQFSEDCSLNSLEGHLNLSQKLAEMQRKLEEEIKEEKKLKCDVERCYLSSKRSRQFMAEDPAREFSWRNVEHKSPPPGPSQHTSAANYCYNTH